jgi:multiple sugar transport system permease protein
MSTESTLTRSAARAEEAVAPVTGAASARRTRRARQPWLVHTLLIGGAVIMIFPFVWELLTAFKTFDGAHAVPPQIIPNPWDFGNFSKVLASLPFLSMLTNSVLLTLGRVAGQVVLCTMAGYAFARLRFPGRTPIFIAFLSVLMVPSQLYLLPQFEIILRLGWTNSLTALIVPGMFSAFGCFLMRQFFMALPNELEEAARVDGANPWQVFYKVMLPLAKPGIIALAVFTALWSWNDLLWPLVVTSDPAKEPLTVGMAQLIGLHFTDFPVLMAAALMACLPMLLTFAILQRQFIQGIALTGTKG